MLELVVAAQPGAEDETAGRASARRPVHPAQHHVGPEAGNLAPQGRAGVQVERPAEAHFGDFDASVAQSAGARLVQADDRALIEAGARERHDEPGEERLGAAVRRPRHGLQDAHRHPSSSRALRYDSRG